MAFDWNRLDERSSVEIPARPQSGLWTPARGYLGTGTVIRICATGQWKPLPDTACGADGLRHWVYGRERLLTRAAPFGALIGRIGGSTISMADGEILAIGALCVLKIDKAEGPLFLTINDAPDGFDDNEGALTVTFL